MKNRYITVSDYDASLTLCQVSDSCVCRFTFACASLALPACGVALEVSASVAGGSRVGTASDP